MKQRRLICVCIPAVHTQMDMYVPIDITLDELCKQVAMLVQEATHARFHANENNVMFRKQDGMCLYGKLRVCDIGLKNSEVCYIM